MHTHTGTRRRTARVEFAPTCRRAGTSDATCASTACREPSSCTWNSSSSDSPAQRCCQRQRASRAASAACIHVHAASCVPAPATRKATDSTGSSTTTCSCSVARGAYRITMDTAAAILVACGHAGVASAKHRVGNDGAHTHTHTPHAHRLRRTVCGDQGVHDGVRRLLPEQRAHSAVRRSRQRRNVTCEHARGSATHSGRDAHAYPRPAPAARQLRRRRCR